jgi:RNA polymerase sigma factor (sigma-70 family)
MHEKTDAELVALARSGNKDAFGQLAERYQPMAERIAMGMLTNSYLAQELAQEAILQAYLSLDHLRDDRQFKSWLYGITLNVCRSYLRDQKTDFFSLEALMGGRWIEATSFLDESLDPQEIAEEREFHRIILHAVHALTSGERLATLLFYYEQRNLREIAAILGISVGTVKGRLNKARKHLREQLAMLYEWTEEDIPLQRRSKTMVKMSVVDVVTRLRKEDMRHVFSTLVLLDEVGHRALGIWIGEAEAAMIHMGLSKSSPIRPMTMNFIANILQAAGATLEEVRIETLTDDIFYAIARILTGGTTHAIDARPSDAIALAVTTDSPIFVSEEILERCGVALPEGKTLHKITVDASIKIPEELQPGEQAAPLDLSIELSKEDYEKQLQGIIRMMLV